MFFFRRNKNWFSADGDITEPPLPFLRTPPPLQFAIQEPPPSSCNNKKAGDITMFFMVISPT